MGIARKHARGARSTNGVVDFRLTAESRSLSHAAAAHTSELVSRLLQRAFGDRSHAANDKSVRVGGGTAPVSLR